MQSFPLTSGPGVRTQVEKASQLLLSFKTRTLRASELRGGTGPHLEACVLGLRLPETKCLSSVPSHTPCLQWRCRQSTLGWKELLPPKVLPGQRRDEHDGVTHNMRSVTDLHSDETAIKLDQKHKVSNKEGARSVVLLQHQLRLRI